MNSSQPLIILIAGPYRSGTNDDPALIQKNLDRLESIALPIFEAGHIPMIGEWVALPIMKHAGSKSLADSVAARYLHPVASRLIERCDAVFRMEGNSTGADEDVRLASEDCRCTRESRKFLELVLSNVSRWDPSTSLK